jgi:ferritin-like metal-binding protein YciE
MSTTTKARKANSTSRKSPEKSMKKSSTTKVNTDGVLQVQKQTAFEKLFENLLKDIYWAEKQLINTLKEMSEAATAEALQDAFEEHMHQTQRHVTRLDKVFGLLGKEAEAKKCEAMEGLIKEGKEVLKETEAGTMTRDAGLIIAAQKVEHYEIAAYGSLVQVALTLGHDKIAGILEMTLNEEEETDHLLTDIAETEVNPMADQEDEDGTKEDE